MTKRALKSSMNKRQKILRLSQAGHSITEIMEQTNCTYFQVYNVINGRVKTSKSQNVGIAAGKPAAEAHSNEDGEPANMDDFDTPEKFVEHQIALAMNGINQGRYKPDARIKLLKDVINLQKELRKLELENYIKKPSPALIVNVIKRLAPSLSDEQILLIIEEEKEKIKQMRF